jgi:3-methyladenine DNA glycosylase/8-oxoguanine DNA glycosylase
MALFIPAREPFSLASVVNSHGWIQLAPFRAGPDPEGLSYIARLPTGKVTELAISPAAGGVKVTADTPPNVAEEDAIRDYVRWMAGVDQDLSEFYAAASDEPKLAAAAHDAKGRILRSPTIFEDVVRTILTTNTLWAATRRMVLTLTTLYGDPLPTDPARHAFPTAEQLAAVDAERLRSEARLGYRAPYIAWLARKVASGDLDLESLKTAELSTPELRKRLLALQGVGPYAAAVLLMFLGHYDYLPTDSWAIKMVSLEFHDGQPVGPAEVEAAFARWGKFKGLAYWFWEWSG